MRKHDSLPAGRDNSQKIRGHLRGLFHSSPTMASILVVATIAVGVLFYAQAGFLTSPHSQPISHEQTAEDSQPTEPSELSKVSNESSLTPKDTDHTPKESNTSNEPQQSANNNRATLNSKTKKPEPVCNEKAKDTAKQVRDQALEVENKLHNQKLAESRGLPLIGNLLNLIDDKVAAENTRHRKAVEAINTTYNDTLKSLHCTN